MKQRVVYLLIWLVFTSLPLTAYGSAIDLSFEEANTAFSKGKYAQAIELYQSILNEWGYSAPVLYNLANSYAMNDQTGLALLNYERALTLSPGDSDIAGNLHLVRTANGLFESEADWTEKLVNILDINQWTLMIEVAVVILTLAVLGMFLRKISGKTAGAICCTSLLAVVIATISIARLYASWDSSIVISKSRLQVSPFDGAASVGDIREGNRVYAKQRHGDYLYVIDDTQRKGWIVASAVERVIPDQQGFEP